jgi:hypothetical protein
MSSPESRRIDELVKRVNALAAQLAALLRPKPTSWVQNSTGGGDAILAVTPVGGIAAMTDATLPIVFTSATCNKINPATGDYYSPNEPIVIYNMVNIAIPATVLIQAKKIGERYFVDVAACGSSTIS